MPFVKILLYERLTNESYYDDDYRSLVILADGISNWEFLQDEELKYLQDNLFRIFHHNDKYVPRIVIQDKDTIKVRIDSIKDLIEKESEKQEAQKTKERKAKEERKRKTKLQAFEKLKKELEENGELTS